LHPPLLLPDRSGTGYGAYRSQPSWSHRLRWGIAWCRAKTKTAMVAFRFEVPPSAKLPQRLDAVLKSYLPGHTTGYVPPRYWAGTIWRCGVDRAAGACRGSDAGSDAFSSSSLMPGKQRFCGFLAPCAPTGKRGRARTGVESKVAIFLCRSRLHSSGLLLLIEKGRTAISPKRRSRRTGRFQLEAAISVRYMLSGRRQWSDEWVHHALLRTADPQYLRRSARDWIRRGSTETRGPEAGLAVTGPSTRFRLGYSPLGGRTHFLQRLAVTSVSRRCFDRAIGLARTRQLDS